jgi:predicted type IV restriction endonuclease
MNALTNIIIKAAERVRDYRDRRVRLTESDTIRVLVLPFLDALGWDLQDVEEVRSEYRHASADNPVDYALFLHATPTLFVEAKALGVSLDDRKPLLQTLNYANAAGVDWCVLTNGAEWRIYKVHAPVAAEEKLFLTVRLGEAGADTGAMAATLSLLSRDRMQARAIDALWSEWRVDRAVERVLDTVTEDDAFIRLITKRADGLTAGEVRASLRRSGLRSFYPEVGAFMAWLDGQPDQARTARDPNPVVPEAMASGAPEAPPLNGTITERAAPEGRARLMKTGEMVDRGLLPVGTTLTIKDRPDSAAKVVDGKRVEFRGEVISFNDWGCRATGWSAIQIYKWAVLPDGRLLEALRGVTE